MNWSSQSQVPGLGLEPTRAGSLTPFATRLRVAQRLGNNRRSRADPYCCADDFHEVFLFRAAYCHDDGYSNEESWHADTERDEHYR